MTQPLLSCPKCGTANFTPRGLSAHKCDGTNRNAKTLAVAVPGATFNDALMGAQLTEQYHLAMKGSVDVLRFGAMLLMLREHLTPLRSQKHEGRGRYPAGSGLKGWLSRHAPKVPEGTAHRFLHFAEAVEAGFPLPSKISFITLATTPSDQLAPKLRKKQKELFDYVTGQSRKSILDLFKPAIANGGARESDLPKLTEAEKYQLAIQQIRDDHKTALDILGSLTGRKAFQALPEKELHAAIETAEEFLTKAREWASTPKTKRSPDFKVL